MKVVESISSGMMTKQEACRHYNIGVGTLYNWIEKTSRLDLYNPRIRVEMPSDQDEKKRLVKRVKELEKALVQSQLERIESTADLEVALEMLGYESLAAFKKKLESDRSKKQ